jgi:Ca2+-binding EF-hand superfamily protein
VKRVLIAISAAAALAALPAVAQHKKPRDPAKAFARMDKDSDGRLSLAEFQNAGKKADPEKRAKRFKKLDTNRDGFLSKEEFLAGIPPEK